MMICSHFASEKDLRRTGEIVQCVERIGAGHQGRVVIEIPKLPEAALGPTLDEEVIGQDFFEVFTSYFLIRILFIVRNKPAANWIEVK